MSRLINKKIIITMTIFAICFFCRIPAALDRKVGEGKETRNGLLAISQAMAKEEIIRSVLSVTPREIDFGEIGPYGVANSLFSLKNVGGGNTTWSTDGPEGWVLMENQGLTGNLSSEPSYLRLSMRSVGSQLSEGSEKTNNKSLTMQLSIEIASNTSIFRKDFQLGAYREPLKIVSTGGTRTVFLNFRVNDAKSESQLDIEPPRLDFGSIPPGKQVAKQIKITNKGRGTVKWRVILPKPSEERQNIPTLKGRYVSFLNEENRAGAAYVATNHLKEVLETSGKWFENDGYPSAIGINNFLRYRFTGTGISVHLWHGPDGGKVAAYLDDQLMQVYDVNLTERGREELPIADGLSDGQHVLTLVNGEGRVIIEGINVYGKELMRGKPGWISVSPESGTITRETDYSNIRIDTRQLNPGYYGEQIIISSSRGDVAVEVAVEIKPDQTPKIIDVYRYVRNHNYLYTTNPQAEASRLQSGGYIKEGIAFRLFAPGTLGTTEFFRWYNSKKDDHYYSYASNGGAKTLKDYSLEGSIGNIATSKLTNTRELYRWYNQEMGGHFYTTDQKGEGIARKGYTFDGIAGYVR